MMQLRRPSSWTRLTVAVLLALLLVAISVAAACGGGGEPDGPRLQLGDGRFDLGTITAGKSVERSIPFQNAGTAPLAVSIQKVRPAPDAACGCGVEGFEVRPEVVPPGESGNLVFSLRVPEGMEAMEDTMYAVLETNEPGKQEVTVEFTMWMEP